MPSLKESFEELRQRLKQGYELRNTSDEPVYSGGLLIDTTDSNGELLIPRVQSYNENRLFFMEKDLPFTYNTKNPLRYISPPYRSGSFLKFDIEKIQAVSGYMTVIEEGHKKTADYWSLTVAYNGKEEVVPIAKQGEFYIENIPAGTHAAVIRKDKKECRFELIVPESTEALINLGTLTCEIKTHGDNK